MAECVSTYLHIYIYIDLYIICQAVPPKWTLLWDWIVVLSCMHVESFVYLKNGATILNLDSNSYAPESAAASSSGI